MGLASTQGKSICNEPAKCFSTLPLLLYDSYYLLSLRNRRLPSSFPSCSSLCVLCSDVTNYSCRAIGNVSRDQRTVIAQLSTTHKDVSEDYRTTEDIFDCCENIMKKSLFAKDCNLTTSSHCDLISTLAELGHTTGELNCGYRMRVVNVFFVLHLKLEFPLRFFRSPFSLFNEKS